MKRVVGARAFALLAVFRERRRILQRPANSLEVVCGTDDSAISRWLCANSFTSRCTEACMKALKFAVVFLLAGSSRI